MHRCTMIAVTVGIFAAAGHANAQTNSAPAAAGIPFSTVAAALAALKAKPGVKFDQEDGWTMAKDTDGANWSFTPNNHYAHPSVGRRSIEQDRGRFFVRTQILCQASKAACDRLHADYALLDKRMNEAIQRDLQKK